MAEKPTPRDETLALLRRIALASERTNRLLAQLVPPPRAATNEELDSPKGDPEVRFVPNGWSGPNFKGSKFSQTTPEFLRALVHFLEWAVEKEYEKGTSEGNKTARFRTRDAMLARGWALRLSQPSPKEEPEW
jgi:hypothetical protein